MGQKFQDKKVNSRPRRKRKGHHHHLGEIAKITRGEYEDSSSDDSSDVPDHFHRRRDLKINCTKIYRTHQQNKNARRKKERKVKPYQDFATEDEEEIGI